MRIFSIFNSIDGEVNVWGQGHFSTFIRTAGCPLRCSYCDTKRAQELTSGQTMSIKEIIAIVDEYGCKRVTVTGGEPLIQPDYPLLIKELLRKGYQISIETSGAIVPVSYNQVNMIMDYKLPSSGMEDEMVMVAFQALKHDDYIKFVVGSDKDYDRMKWIIKVFRKTGVIARMAASPTNGKYSAEKLVEKLRADSLFNIIVNIQIHKYIWPDAKVEV